MFLCIAKPAKTSSGARMPSAARKTLRPSGCAEFGELLAGQRIWHNGLDALPNAPELGLRCPCGPSLRSGNPLAAARADALRSCGLGPSAQGSRPTLRPGCPTAVGAVGLSSPHHTDQRLGRFNRPGRPIVRALAPPSAALPSVGAGQSLRPPGLRAPSGADLRYPRVG